MHLDPVVLLQQMLYKERVAQAAPAGTEDGGRGEKVALGYGWQTCDCHSLGYLCHAALKPAPS